MHLTFNNRRPVDDGIISFPVLQCWNPETRVVTIAAQVCGKRVSCRVSHKDLRKKFHVFEDKPMQTVTEHRPQIEAAARRLIEKKNYEQDGSILIRYQDL